MRAEPRTFNPFSALDSPSREIIRLVHADLISINRATLATEGLLASQWKVSPDRRAFELTLRPGLKFNDGTPLAVDDVLASLAAYLDPATGSPQRDALLTDGQPPQLRRLDDARLAIVFSAPQASAERIFDSLFILPRHLVAPLQESGGLAAAFGTASPADQLVGAGPYRLVRYEPGQRVLLERNAHFHGNANNARPLPRIEIRFTPDADAEALQLRGGRLDLVTRIPANTFLALRKSLPADRHVFSDGGPSLEYHFLFFNQGTSAAVPAAVRQRQLWFRNAAFRRAISLAIDRSGIRRLVHAGYATELWQPVSPAHGTWFNASLPRPQRSLAEARRLLRGAGFSWDSGGALQDAGGSKHGISVVVNAANVSHMQTVTMIQHDLQELGITLNVVPLEFRSLVDRVMNKRDYDAAFMALSPGDTDPLASINVWRSDGTTHFWDPQPATADREPWQMEVDRLSQLLVSEADPDRRRTAYHRLQTIAQQELPLIAVVAPHVLSIVPRALRNWRPGRVPPYALAEAQRLTWDAGR